jgi:alpha-amylase
MFMPGPLPHNSMLALVCFAGTPCVFWDHLFQDKDGLRKSVIGLVELRKKHGINARSKVTIRKAAADVYACTIDDKLAMKIGPGDWSPNSAGIKLGNSPCKIAASGYNFAVWEAA